MINGAVTDRLTAEGYDVTQAYDGPAAVQAFADHQPDLVVLDVMLPGFDGHEVCRRIQAVRPVPVLMLTARDDETDVLVGLGVGADDYVTKPFRMREVVARVAALLRRVDRAAELAGASPPTWATCASTPAPVGSGRRRRGAPDADRVRPADVPGGRARRRTDARAAARRGVGLARRLRHPHGRQPRQGAARQDRRRSGAHRARRRLRPGTRGRPARRASSTRSARSRSSSVCSSPPASSWPWPSRPSARPEECRSG